MILQNGISCTKHYTHITIKGASEYDHEGLMLNKNRSIIIIDKCFTINVRDHIDSLLYKKSSDPYAIFSAFRSEFYRAQGNECRDISRHLCVENRVLSRE